jgi:hypothetical protein
MYSLHDHQRFLSVFNNSLLRPAALLSGPF